MKIKQNKKFCSHIFNLRYESILVPRSDNNYKEKKQWVQSPCKRIDPVRGPGAIVVVVVVNTMRGNTIACRTPHEDIRAQLVIGRC